MTETSAAKLRIHILEPREALPADDVLLHVTYTNDGDAPLALTFWWTRTLRVVDEAGHIVAPNAGPVLPCGVAEEWTVLAPGETFTRDEGLACTQPAGQSAEVGWSYAHLAAGRYSITVVMTAPPAHGFSQSRPDPRAFVGTVESNSAAVVIAEPKAKGFLSRVLGR